MDRESDNSKSAESDVNVGKPGMSPDPSEAEVEAWAERVRLGRRAWMDGPTEEEKLRWQRRERRRRSARTGLNAESGFDYSDQTPLNPYEERLHLQHRYAADARRYAGDVRLATEGLGVLIATWPFRALANLVVTGREWEEEILRPAGRRCIPFGDDDE